MEEEVCCLETFKGLFEIMLLPHWIIRGLSILLGSIVDHRETFCLFLYSSDTKQAQYKIDFSRLYNYPPRKLAEIYMKPDFYSYVLYLRWK